MTTERNFWMEEASTFITFPLQTGKKVKTGVFLGGRRSTLVSAKQVINLILMDETFVIRIRTYVDCFFLLEGHQAMVKQRNVASFHYVERNSSFLCLELASLIELSSRYSEMEDEARNKDIRRGVAGITTVKWKTFTTRQQQRLLVPLRRFKLQEHL